MTKTINLYNQKAKYFLKEYESVDADKIHQSWVSLIPYAGGLALDIGAGSGRDAPFAL